MSRVLLLTDDVDCHVVVTADQVEEGTKYPRVGLVERDVAYDPS
jgi:hypothetical protein